MNAEKIDYGIIVMSGGVIIPIFHYMYGEGEIRMAALALMFLIIALDWVSGIRAAEKDESYASLYGLNGAFRTVFIIFLPAAGHLFDIIFGLPGIAFGALTFGVTYHSLKSMLANAIRAGWEKWVPTRTIEWVASELQHKMNRSEKRKNGRDD